MSGSTSPIRVCDRDCAAANGCCLGGLQCESCGRYFCADEMCESGICDKCEEERENESEDEDGD